jgi:predicted phage replisome organizer
MKKLRKVAGGEIYTLIYLKLQLLSLEKEGLIEFDGIEETLAEELELEIDEKKEHIEATLFFLEKCGLAEVINNKDLIFHETIKNIGKETESAIRVRKFRNKSGTGTLQCNEKVLQCNSVVTKCNTEIELEKEIELETDKKKKSKKEKFFLFGEYEKVKLTKSEYEKLESEFGTEDLKEMIKELDEGIELKGYKYKNFNLALRKWKKKSEGNYKANYYKPKKSMILESDYN